MMRCCKVFLTPSPAAILLAKDDALLMLVTKAHTEEGTQVLILPLAMRGMLIWIAGKGRCTDQCYLQSVVVVRLHRYSCLQWVVQGCERCCTFTCVKRLP